jgi:phytoene synthase
MWAYEAQSSPVLGSQLAPDFVDLKVNLQNAYGYCERMTRINSRTFYMACNLLPFDKRQALHAMYAFCRSTDDLIDKAATGLQTNQADALVSHWRARLVPHHATANDPVPLAWADTQRRFAIPRGYADQLIDGITRDLRQTRYGSFGELTEYCYGVASTVGLMTMYVIGFRNEEALPYAVKLGIALQLTNILRDVGEDWRAGRLYLPQEELDDFGVSESAIANGRVDEKWRAFMRFQISRARQLYQEAEAGIALLDADGRFAIAAAAGLYRAILERIEANDYDVFRQRAHLGAWGKVRRLPHLWWAAR